MFTWLNRALQAFRVATDCAEKPHCGKSGVPFMNSTTGAEAIWSLMRVTAGGGGVGGGEDPVGGTPALLSKNRRAGGGGFVFWGGGGGGLFFKDIPPRRH